MADFKVALPLEYYRKHLEQDVRPDGRKLGEARPSILNIGSIATADGSALVKLGNTTVLCGIKGELGVPSNDSPNKGSISATVELPAMCSPLFRTTTNPEEAQVATHFITDLLTCSGCIDLGDLIVVESKHAWELQCDLVCLEYDGNLLDACSLALLAALTNTSLPKVTISEETGLPEVNTADKSPLRVLSHPVATTFITIDSIVIMDPSAEEESLSDGRITVVTKDADCLCMMYMPGGTPLSDTCVQKCITRAQERRLEVKRLLKKTNDTLTVAR